MAVGDLRGAFDPPHNGHVALARTAMERLGLERLHVTVVVAPGHKETVAPAEYRLELARLAFAGARHRRARAVRVHRRRARGSRLRGSGLPDRRRRARGLPDVEGAGARARAGAARCRDTPRLPAGGGVADGSRSSSSSRTRSRPPRSASASAAGSRSTGLVPAAVAAADRGARSLPGCLTSLFRGYTECSDFDRSSTPDRRSREARSWQKTSSSST